MYLRGFCLFLLLALAWGSTAWAQSRGSDLDVMDRQLRTPPSPKSQPRAVVAEAPDGQVTYDESLRFTLGSIRVEGARAFSPEALVAPYAGRFGQAISFDEINQIAAEMSKRYREAGYLLSRVALPAQEVDPASAHITLVAIEGFIAQVEYVSQDADLAQKVAKRFAGQEKKLMSRRPLRHRDFERALRLLSDFPGLSVSSTFREAEVPGGSTLVIIVDRQIIEGSLGFNNTGTESSGPWMYNAGLSFSSAPFLGSRTSINYTQAADYREYYNASLSFFQQWLNGFSFNASYAYSESQEPDTDFARLFDHATESKTLSLGLNYALIRSRDLNLSLGLAYTHRDSKAELLDEPYTRDRLRSLTYSLNVDFADELGGVTQIMPSFTRGLGAFGATDYDFESSSPLAPAAYRKGNLYLSRNQRLPGNFSLLLTGEIQLAGTVLPSYEQYSLGGGQFGRGYDPGALESDNGAAGSLELRWSGSLTETIDLQPYAFIDGGTVWTKGRIDGVDPHAELSSAGLGFRLWFNPADSFLSRFHLDAYVGKPLKTVDEDSSARWIITTSFIF